MPRLVALRASGAAATNAESAAAAAAVSSYEGGSHRVADNHTHQLAHPRIATTLETTALRASGAALRASGATNAESAAAAAAVGSHEK